MTIDIPILIPVKERSLRCARKNYALLPYTAQYLHAEGVMQQATVITDSESLIQLATDLGMSTHFEIRKPEQDELTSCYNYATEKSIPLFFLCPATQPLRGSGLLQMMYELFEKDNQYYDFITTISLIQDRSLFFVKEHKEGWKFATERKHRKGSECTAEYMIDGALYLIRTSFMEKVINVNDANEIFWKGNFGCVKNDAPFMDIDTQEDMRQFEFLKEYFGKMPAALAV